MIVEAIINVLMSPLDLLFLLLKPFTLALPGFQGLAQPIMLFNGVVGGNVLSLIFSSFSFWVTTKSTYGVLVYLYNLLPLT